MECIGWIIAGAVAGWLSGIIVKGGGYGLVGNVIVGVIGSVVGGWLFGFLGITIGGTVGSIIVSVVGAVTLISVLRLFVKG